MNTRWHEGYTWQDEVIARDALAIARVVLKEPLSEGDGAMGSIAGSKRRAAMVDRLGSAFDLTTLALQLAPAWGTPTHTAALLLRGKASSS